MAQIGIADTAAVRAAALVEHYQRTSEFVLQEWRRRNRQAIILIAILAAAGLVAFARQLIAPVLLALTSKHLELDPAAIERLRAFMPLASDLLLGFLIISIFYLIAILTHRSGMIINLYLYMSMLEVEIRRELQVAKDHVAFTREGPFYEITGTNLTRLLGFCHKAVLGLLLVFFFASRLYFDQPTAWVPLRVLGREDAVNVYGWLIGNFLFVIDVLIVIPTMWLFWRYARLRAPSEDYVRQEIARRQGLA